MATEVELVIYPPLRKTVGQKYLSPTLSEDATVRDVLIHLLEEYPDLGEYLLDDSGDLVESLAVLLEGTNAEYDEQVPDGAEISITTQIVGG